ncbi:MAG: hypothetical protein ACPHS7_06685, partial [Candidatus Puniceispirillaceae bacterium]
MTNKDQKAATSSVIRALRALRFADLYARFGPEIRRGNQPDMPIVTTNRIWFLRENRFLVFTRSGPVEVTLKPSMVLAGILICMAGVATIFYSTIIASFSAIEVMREETIKTAQASANPEDGAVFNKDDTAASALTWFGYNLASHEDSHPPSIAGKIAQPPGLLVGRITTQPAVTTPQIPQTSQDAKIAADDAMPMIIQGGKRITLASNAASDEPQFGDDATNITNKPRANDPSSPTIMPIIVGQSLANQKTIKAKVSENSLITEIDTEQTDAKKAGTNLTAASNPIIKNDTKPTSLAARAQEFTIALLPNFVSAPEGQKSVQIQPDQNNVDAIDAVRVSPPLPKLPAQPVATIAALPATPNMPKADGLLTGFFTQRQGPALPLVTEAAKTKKMLLALEQEIDYIRATVTGLGISAAVLPTKIQLATIAKDTDFKNMMVNLAEHRAALRKIPFKPPMLYFYISSD